MEKVNDNKQVEKTYSKSLIGAHLTINDLREKEFRGERLTAAEAQALQNFDKYRLEELNRQMTDDGFQKIYKHFQVLANLGPYEDFIRGKYSL